MYWYLDVSRSDSESQRHIIRDLGNGAMMSFPADPENPHFHEYLQWLDAGNPEVEFPTPEVE